MGRKSTYDEPTTLWRLRHVDGRSAHGLIIPAGPKASAFWFMAGAPQRARDFRTWRDAIDWLDDVRATLETSGWSWWDRPRPRVSAIDSETT
jgi:hypothetical protein